MPQNDDTKIISRENLNTKISTEHIKLQLKHDKETKELSFRHKEKIVDAVLSPNFFVFIIIIAMIFSGFIFMAVKDVTKNDIVEYWKVIMPVITTYIGYALSKRNIH